MLDLAVFIISSFVENSIILKVFDFSIVFCICYNIAKLFKKKPVINGIIGGILTGLWLAIIGADKKAVYDNNIVVSPNGPFGA